MRARGLSGRLQTPAREAITLRQGGHHPEAGWPYHRKQSAPRDPPRQGRSSGRLGAGVGSDCASGAVSATGSAVSSITFSPPLRRAPASISRNASSASPLSCCA